MQAVNESELVQGKIVVCRKIAEDVANTVGIDKDEWITSRYWEIKRYVGFHHARVSTVSVIAVPLYPTLPRIITFANNVAMWCVNTPLSC